MFDVGPPRSRLLRPAVFPERRVVWTAGRPTELVDRAGVDTHGSVGRRWWTRPSLILRLDPTTETRGQAPIVVVAADRRPVVIAPRLALTVAVHRHRVDSRLTSIAGAQASITAVDRRRWFLSPRSTMLMLHRADLRTSTRERPRSAAVGPTWPRLHQEPATARRRLPPRPLALVSRGHGYDRTRPTPDPLARAQGSAGRPTALTAARSLATAEVRVATTTRRHRRLLNLIDHQRTRRTDVSHDRFDRRRTTSSLVLGHPAPTAAGGDPASPAPRPRPVDRTFRHRDGTARSSTTTARAPDPVVVAPPTEPTLDLDRLSTELWNRFEKRERVERQRRGRS